MISARERVHKAFKAARDAGAANIAIPDCVIFEYAREEAKHDKVCNEMTSAVEFDRTLIRNGHDATPQAEPTA